MSFQTVEISFFIAERDNHLNEYLNCILSILPFTMFCFFLRARWVGIFRSLIMFQKSQRIDSKSREMAILACASFWPIVFTHTPMIPITSFVLESSFLNIWWTLGPFASSN